MSVIPLRPRFEVVPPPPAPVAEALPEDLCAELDAAMDVADGIARAGVGLRFVRDTRRVRLELLEADGQLRRSLSAVESLDLAAGRMTP